MRVAALISIISIIIWSTVSVLEIWFDIISSENYLKLSLSLFIIGISSLIVGIAHREYIKKKNLRDQGYIEK